MAFTEDPSIFLADFGVPVSFGAVSGVGLLDMPTEIVADGVVLTTDYKLTCLNSVFGAAKYNDTITVNSITYKVRETMLVDDGVFCSIMLMRP
jgi:hypothetical protein